MKWKQIVNSFENLFEFGAACHRQEAGTLLTIRRIMPVIIRFHTRVWEGRILCSSWGSGQELPGCRGGDAAQHAPALQGDRRSLNVHHTNTVSCRAVVLDSGSCWRAIYQKLKNIHYSTSVPFSLSLSLLTSSNISNTGRCTLPFTSVQLHLHCAKSYLTRSKCSFTERNPPRSRAVCVVRTAKEQMAHILEGSVKMPPADLFCASVLSHSHRFLTERRSKCFLRRFILLWAPREAWRVRADRKDIMFFIILKVSSGFKHLVSCRL